ncbi:hypothetical protein BCR37DRAFT_391728 [Protomyces lactucae-debilis]|uniref:Hydrophobic surface binding protein A-domain-containing protein n=1 Tax=Protomyces lactucae-debilis TaxID=2754530 RepID=A0A1Y2FNY1_PROLT|nr:uncharacterized protein BCR37DRAFT_391728 [Protomyces lactucae-debilis]ORY85034.1 hypothetical protein BCR37DRAFT_391728 [Protomyces lactucae-debilis]
MIFKTNTLLALATVSIVAQAQAPASPSTGAAVNADSKIGGIPANVKAQLPKLDSKAVAAANQQQQEAGINELCAQSLSRVADSWKTAQQSVTTLASQTTGSAVDPAVQAAQRFLATTSPLISNNIRAGTKTDASLIKTYEDAGSAVGQAMGAISQVQQVQGMKPEILQAANMASINLQNLRTAQFATFGACGAAVGATIAATDEAKPAGVPGSAMKVVCGH